jgi:hypothetical protein
MQGRVRHHPRHRERMEAEGPALGRDEQAVIQLAR